MSITKKMDNIGLGLCVIIFMYSVYKNILFKGVNIPYLLLRSIKFYYNDLPIMQKIYTELRNNIIKTVCSNWEETSYFFELYNEKNGTGYNNFPFSKFFFKNIILIFKDGWTSLITLIIEEKYFPGDGIWDLTS